MAKAGRRGRGRTAGEELAQVAAVPVRQRRDGLEVCLVTTRETRRWTVPKGWPMKGRKAWAVAAIEAEQEAGLVGAVEKKPLGDYVYWKRLDDHFVLVRVKAFRLEVQDELETFAERGQRSVHWCSPEDAAVVVDEPGLATILRDLSEKARAARDRSARSEGDRGRSG